MQQFDKSKFVSYKVKILRI